MMRKFALVAVTAAVVSFSADEARAAGVDTSLLERQSWSWQGVFGRYDVNQLRRGFQVYKEVCASCHGVKYVAYRNLSALGFSEEEIREIAAMREFEDGPDDTGEMFMRPGEPTDYMVSPFPNEQFARMVNNGAYPPDLSLMNKARFGGPDYMYNLLTGYIDPPDGFDLMDGMHYNRVFPGHQIAMGPQLFEGMIEYQDGTPATISQQAADITAFLNWTAEPELEERHSLGIKVMLYLLVLTGMLYALKRRIWKRLH